MPTGDQQILVAGTAPAPADFLIPGNGQLQPKAVNAIFDGTGASGDFAPTLEIISDAGVVVSRVPASTVKAGDAAEVTFAPFLEATGAASGATTFNGCRVRQTLGQLIASSAATDLTWNTADFDVGGMTDLTHNAVRITCQTAGYYWLGVGVDFGSNQTGDRETRITLNGLFSTATGTLIAYSNSATTQKNILASGYGCQTVYQLAVGDYVTGGALQSSGVVLGVSGNASHYFGAVRVG